MTKLLPAIGVVLCMVAASNSQVLAPAITGGKCAGKIYKGKEVTRRARIDLSDLLIPKEANDNNVHGTLVIEAVLCRNGRVTDIQVIKSLPFGVTESAINQLLKTQFSPAELNFHSVSERMQFEFSVNETSMISGINPAAAAGRLVEDLDVIGNRRMTKEEILGWIKTRPGDPYNDEQVKQDLNAIYATGFFNRSSTRVTIEDAVRGGVRVIFEVMELPLIAEITFEGLKRRDQSTVINELARQRVGVRVGAPLDPAILKKATQVIEQFFQSQGWVNIKAESFFQNLTGTEVKVIFKVTGQNF